MLMREGASAGPNPVVDVLEFGSKHATRTASDILPYLTVFAGMFTPLTTKADDMVLRVIKIPVTDIECLTWTVLKLRVPTWYMSIGKGQC